MYGEAISHLFELRAITSFYLLSMNVLSLQTATIRLCGRTTLCYCRTRATRIDLCTCYVCTVSSSVVFPRRLHTTGCNCRRGRIIIEVDSFVSNYRRVNVIMALLSYSRYLYEAHSDGVALQGVSERTGNIRDYTDNFHNECRYYSLRCDRVRIIRVEVLQRYRCQEDAKKLFWFLPLQRKSVFRSATILHQACIV
jgi:hypothetical protein